MSQDGGEGLKPSVILASLAKICLRDMRPAKPGRADVAHVFRVGGVSRTPPYCTRQYGQHICCGVSESVHNGEPEITAAREAGRASRRGWISSRVMGLVER